MVSDHSSLFIAVPRTVHVWRRAPCNARCIMCNLSFLNGEALREATTSPFTDAFMPRALHEIQQLSGRGTMVSLLSGEPTLSHHITDWIELAGRLGLDFRFTTNGYLIDEEMAARFVSAGLFNIGISIESLDPKINETLRPFHDGTARTLRSIALLLGERERQKKKVSLNIKTVLTDINLESFPEIVERFGRLDGVICTPQVFEALEGMPQATIDRLRVQDPDRLWRVIKRIRQMKREGYSIHVTDQALDDMIRHCRYGDRTETLSNKKLKMEASQPKCNIGTDNLWIENGEVKLCPNFPAIGNFIDHGDLTLKEMWHGEPARLVRAHTRACRQLCTLSCLRRTPLRHKISMFFKLA
jgi:MoaA/NifB/PqqE/SkfB family radical SAM enzyme